LIAPRQDTFEFWVVDLHLAHGPVESVAEVLLFG